MMNGGRRRNEFDTSELSPGVGPQYLLWTISSLSELQAFLRLFYLQTLKGDAVSSFTFKYSSIDKSKNSISSFGKGFSTSPEFPFNTLILPRLCTQTVNSDSEEITDDYKPEFASSREDHSRTMESSACHQTPALDRDAPVPQSSSYYLPSGNSPQAYPGESQSEKLASSSISLGSTKSRRGIKARENQYKETPHRSRNVRKWALIGAGIVIVVGLIVGIVAWKVTARKNGSSSNKKLEYIEGTSKTVKSDPSNPSKFEKDSRLKPVFYGIAYTPLNAQEPSCGATLANVTEDIQLLSQLTTRIRTYDQSCNQTELILQAIQDTKVNMTVWFGASLSPTYNLTYTAHQQDLIIDALDKYGTDHVEGVTIGNDFALHTDSTAGRASLINYVVEEVNDFRTRLASKNYRKTLPVGSADDVETWGLTYSQAVDYMMVNTHAFPLITPSGRGGWTWETVMQAASPWPELVSNHPARYITEVGWPSDSMDNVNRTQNGAVAGIAGLQTCLDSFPCQANLNGTRYFYSEAFDQPWKEELGGVEPYFGLFDHNRKLKNITLPDCAINSRQASG